MRRGGRAVIVEGNDRDPHAPANRSGPAHRPARCGRGACSRTFAAMIDPTTNPDAVEPPDQPLEVAPRMRALPPYLFGKINELKYRKRRAGDRRHRPGHGQPHRPARAVGHRQALRGGPRRRGTTATASPRACTTSAARSPARYENRYGVSARPRHRGPGRRSARRRASATCAWPCSGPGDTAIVPAPSLPDPRLRRGPGLGQRHQPRLHATRTTSWPTSRRSASSLYPQPKVLDPQLSRTTRRPRSSSATSSSRSWPWPGSIGFMVIHDFAYGDVCFDGYQAPSFLSVAGGQGRRRRDHDDEQGLQHGRLAARLLRRQPPRWSGRWRRSRATTTTASSRPSRSPAIVALRHGEEPRRAQVAEYQARRDVLVDGLQPPRLGGREPQGRHVRLGDDPRALAIADGLDRLRHEAAGGGRGRRQPRPRLRRVGRRLPPPGPGRERAAPPAGGPPDRPLPEGREGRRARLPGSRPPPSLPEGDRRWSPARTANAR